MKQISEISPTFCVSPWMEMTLVSNSFLGVCCYAHTIRDENGRIYNLIEDRLEDFWNSWSLREMRRKMLAGEKVSACQSCYYAESIGKTSRRLDFNKVWLELKHYRKNTPDDILNRVEKSKINGYKVEHPPLRLDIRPKNLCNLKCRMCTPTDSSKIEQEQKELLKSDLDANIIEKSTFFDTTTDKKSYLNWGGNKKEVWKSIYKWSPEIRSLYFTGGEPALIKEIWNYIDYLKEKDLAKNIELEFNTNCTQKSDKFIETFSSFPSVFIRFSVDGYKEVNDYIRFPSKWIEVKNNIIKILKNKNQNNIQIFRFIVTIQVYNILNLPQLLTWFNRLKTDYLFNICTAPDFLNIDILPENVKKTALLKLKEHESACKRDNPELTSIKNSLKNKEKPDIEKHLKNFYKYTTLLDRHRGNSFKRTFPELNALLNEDGRWKA